MFGDKTLYMISPHFKEKSVISNQIVEFAMKCNGRGCGWSGEYAQNYGK